MGPRASRRAQLHPIALHTLLKLAVEGGEALLRDLLRLNAANVALLAGAQLLGGDLLGPPAQAVGDVAAIEAYLATVPVDAADDEVGVGMIRIVVVDGAPFELAPEVARDAGHEPANVVSELELARILGRDDEPELMLLAGARLFEGARSHRAFGPVEHTFRSILLDAVALDVPQVQ